MTNKEKKEYLYQYRNLESSIERLIEEQERWKSRAEKITPTLTGMPNGGDGEDQRELAVCNMVDCQVEINRLIDQLCNLRNEVRHYILTTGDKDEKLLVILKIEKQAISTC